MGMWELILGIAIFVMTAYLIFAVLMQSSKDKRLSGTIAGGFESLSGKTKAKKWDKFFSTSTLVVSIVFSVVVVAMYIVVS